jgi:tRNA-modifying protein YgfZ
MSEFCRTPSTSPALLEFRGPDAVRFLNGQLTQDVKLLEAGKHSLPSCVTDAKGRLQFRITLTKTDGGALWVAGPSGTQEALEARLTRYLIADEVEVADLSGQYILTHWIDQAPPPPDMVMARTSNRFGTPGIDWWSPSNLDLHLPTHRLLSVEELETLRIDNGIPAWGHELKEGMLPPEALLDATDVSYHKGCYVGQEVISRMKSAGKINRRLTKFAFASETPLSVGPLADAAGASAGELTSVSPNLNGEFRNALGYVKRGASACFFRAPDGSSYPASIR